MGRKGDKVDGLLLLDKPAGMTSNRALQTVRRLLNARKAGHTGSLDPAATGMLPLCFGEATKVCGYLLDADKHYRVTVRLGASTDTADGDGTVIETAAVPALTADDWDGILQGFLGESTQVPPMYSALKKDGRRLYELARQGEVIEREPRAIRIDQIRLLEARGTRLVFRVHCSKGTYIRSLVEDVAKKAGTLAFTASLHREAVGGFAAKEMLNLAAVRRLADAGELAGRLLPPDVALGAMPGLTVDSATADRFISGQASRVHEQPVSGLVRAYGPSQQFLGVGEVLDATQLAPKRVFNLEEKTP